MSSSDRFGFEWDKYDKINHKYEGQFKNWIFPLSEKDFLGKKILDAGCGMGRNSYWPLKWGAKEVVAFDFDKRSVKSAEYSLKKFNNAKVLFKSVYDIEWRNEFDIAFSIGVIHHLKHPKKALKKIVESIKSGGKLVVWVYGYEGNEWIVRWVNPVRKSITSKLPVKIVHFLSYFCSIPLYLFIKIFKGPSHYLKQLSDFEFWHVHCIVFDQLIPDVANYWHQEEVKRLLDGLDLANISVCSPPNKSGWIINADKK